MARDSSYHQRSPAKFSRRDSPSRRERSLERHKSSYRGGSPDRDKRRNYDRSPDKNIQRSPSPERHRKSHKESNFPVRDRYPPRAKSPGQEKSRSVSPRTKRIRSSQTDRDSAKKAEKVHTRSNGRSDSKDMHREKGDEKMRGNAKVDGELESENRGPHRSNGRSEKVNSPDRSGVTRDIDYERNERRLVKDDTDKQSSKVKRSHASSPDRYPKGRNCSPNQSSGPDDLHELSNPMAEESGNVEDDSVAKMKAAAEALEAKQKDKPSFELSGKLAAETNRVKGVTLLFSEPSDARKPNLRWQLFVFKGGELQKDPLYIHRQSCYLFGRERRVADIPTDHPSCSKQHAVLQFRQVSQEESDGTTTKKVRPYLMDLGSTNKTFVNENPIEPQRYYELFEKDTIKFGNSSREYVLLHENSAS